jgi:hypothetical protein
MCLVLFDRQLFGLYVLIGVPAVLILTVFAGVSEPYNKSVATIERLIAGIFFLVFEYFAIQEYRNTETIYNAVFLLRQGVALLFLGAFYISIREIRKRNQHEIYLKEHRNDT